MVFIPLDLVQTTISERTHTGAHLSDTKDNKTIYWFFGAKVSIYWKQMIFHTIYSFKNEKQKLGQFFSANPIIF